MHMTHILQSEFFCQPYAGILILVVQLWWVSCIKRYQMIVLQERIPSLCSTWSWLRVPLHAVWDPFFPMYIGVLLMRITGPWLFFYSFWGSIYRHPASTQIWVTGIMHPLVMNGAKKSNPLSPVGSGGLMTLALFNTARVQVIWFGYLVSIKTLLLTTFPSLNFPKLESLLPRD